MDTLKCIELKLEGDVATIRLARPDNGNALNYLMVNELKEAITLLDNTEAVRFIRFESSGDVFCAGLDDTYLFNLQRYGFNENLIDVNHLTEMLNTLMASKKTTVAVVNGNALSEGLVFCLLCDHVVTGKQAAFGVPDISQGRIPALVGAYLLKRVGPYLTRKLILSGALFSAKEVNSWGLFQHPCDGKDTQEAADELIMQLRKHSSKGTVEFTKRILNDMQELGLMDALGLAVKMSAHARDTREFKLGLAAALNKEAVDWAKHDNPFA